MGNKKVLKVDLKIKIGEDEFGALFPIGGSIADVKVLGGWFLRQLVNAIEYGGHNDWALRGVVPETKEGHLEWLKHPHNCLSVEETEYIDDPEPFIIGEKSI